MSIERIKVLLAEHPELLPRVAEFVGVTEETVKGWADGLPSMAGLTSVLQDEFVRRHESGYAQEPVAEIRQAMINGLADKAITVEQVVAATGVNKHHLTVYLRGRCGDPGGERLLRTRMFLTAKKLLNEEWRAAYRPEVLLLVDEFVGGKSLEDLSAELSVTVSQLKAWVFGYNDPTPAMLETIAEKFGRFEAEVLEHDVVGTDEAALLAFASMIKGVAESLLEFVVSSTPQQREFVRSKMGSTSDLVDASNAIFSERARQQVLEDRQKRNRRRQ